MSLLCWLSRLICQKKRCCSFKLFDILHKQNKWDWISSEHFKTLVSLSLRPVGQLRFDTHKLIFVCYMFLAPKQEMWSVACVHSTPLLPGLSQDSMKCTLTTLHTHTHTDMLIWLYRSITSREASTGHSPCAYSTFAECYFRKKNHWWKRCALLKVLSHGNVVLHVQHL